MKIPLSTLLLSAILLTGLSGCHFLENFQPHLWLYAPKGDTPAEDSLLSSASFLELRPDGSYTRDFGRFEYGNWNLKDQQLYLTDQRHITYVYRLKNMDRKNMDLVMAKGEVASFNGFALPAHKEEEDPFSGYNNRWRIPATHKESDADIRRRLFEHCRFWEVYFSWAVNNHIEILDVRQMPTPIKIYGNGFGLRRYTELPTEWRSYFFDEEDCHKADSLIKHTFKRNKIIWPDTDDDNKKFVSGFQQLEKFLK